MLSTLCQGQHRAIIVMCPQSCGHIQYVFVIYKLFETKHCIHSKNTCMFASLPKQARSIGSEDVHALKTLIENPTLHLFLFPASAKLILCHTFKLHEPITLFSLCQSHHAIVSFFTFPSLWVIFLPTSPGAPSSLPFSDLSIPLTLCVSVSFREDQNNLSSHSQR